MGRQDGGTPLEVLEGAREAIADHALDLVAFDTRKPPGETRAIVEWLDDSLGGLGVETETYAVDPAKPNFLATLPGERDDVLCFNGHLDTVPFDADAWTHDPIGQRVGNRIYGRGATDMKGAVAPMLATAAAYAESDTTPPVTRRFAFVADEETGGDAGLGALVDAGLLDADACVVGGPTGAPTRPSVAIAGRGSIWLTMEAVGEAAH